MVGNLNPMNILTNSNNQGYAKVEWAPWEALSSLLLEVLNRVVQDLGEDVTLWMEGLVFWMSANPESVCSLNVHCLCLR